METKPHTSGHAHSCGTCGQAIPLKDWPGAIVCAACLDLRPADSPAHCQHFCGGEEREAGV